MKYLIFCLLFIFPGPMVAADITPVTRSEISHLLVYLETSGCRFNRNGTWYPSGEAALHIRKKYEYLLAKNLVQSAENFIERAASKSSMSGKLYMVRCGQSAPLSSESWFKAELQKFRLLQPGSGL